MAKTITKPIPPKTKIFFWVLHPTGGTEEGPPGVSSGFETFTPITVFFSSLRKSGSQTSVIPLVYLLCKRIEEIG